MNVQVNTMEQRQWQKQRQTQGQRQTQWQMSIVEHRQRQRVGFGVPGGLGGAAGRRQGAALELPPVSD